MLVPAPAGIYASYSTPWNEDILVRVAYFNSGYDAVVVSGECLKTADRHVPAHGAVFQRLIDTYNP